MLANYNFHRMFESNADLTNPARPVSPRLALHLPYIKYNCVADAAVAGGTSFCGLSLRRAVPPALGLASLRFRASSRGRRRFFCERWLSMFAGAASASQ